MRDRIQQTFDSVKASEEQKQALRDYLMQQCQKAAPKRSPVFVRAAVVFSVLLLCFIFTGLYLMRTTAYTVHIDTSPAVVLDLNRFDKVISVTASDAENTALLEELSSEELSVEGMTCPEAVDALLATEAIQSSLSENPEPSVTVKGQPPEQAEQICTGIRLQVRARHKTSGAAADTGTAKSAAPPTETPAASSAAAQQETPQGRQGAGHNAGQAQKQNVQAQKQLRRHGKN